MVAIREINGTALHRKLIDIVLMPLIVAALLWIGRTVMGNQTKLVEIESRLHNIETKTTLICPRRTTGPTWKPSSTRRTAALRTWRMPFGTMR